MMISNNFADTTKNICIDFYASELGKIKREMNKICAYKTYGVVVEMEQGWAEVLLALLQDLSRGWASVRGWGVIEVGHFGYENIIAVLNGALGMG